MQTIRSIKTGEIVGYFHLTHGAPENNTVWISMFVIHPKFQGRGFGQETIEGLCCNFGRQRLVS